MSDFNSTVEFTGLMMEGIGVVVIVVGMVVALGRFVGLGVRGVAGVYHRLRQDLGRGILLGLEFLVAGDIIRTVAVEPNFENVLVLAVIVLVRTFLSMSLHVELEGRWPWQKVQDGKI